MSNPSNSHQTVRAFSVAVAAVLLTSLLASFASRADRPVSDDLCGVAILEDLDLDHDLLCTGPGPAFPGDLNKFNGPIVGASGIVVNLNGHSITGSGSQPSFGITVDTVSDVSIMGPGTVTKFGAGVAVTSSTNIKIEDLTLVDNNYGGFLPSRAGIRISGSSDVMVSRNDISGSTSGVHLVGSTGNTLEKNKITATSFGIQFTTSTGNTAEKNKITGNQCGVRSASGNSLVDNKLNGNINDFC